MVGERRGPGDNRARLRTPRTHAAARCSSRRWVPEMTSAGRQYLLNGLRPDARQQPKPRAQGRERRSTLTISPGELLAQLEAGGGSLRIPNPSAEVRAAWRRAIHGLSVDGGLPPDNRLRHAGRDQGDMVIHLVPVDPAPVPRSSVAVPPRLSRPHPMIVATQANMRTLRIFAGFFDGRRLQGSLRIRVSQEQLNRALRIGHALFDAAEHRGLEVRVGQSGGACIAAKGHEYEITIVEEMDRTPRMPSRSEGRMRVDPWSRDSTHDVSPSGRLQLQLPDRYNGDRRTWSDRARWRLEDKLGDVLAEIERRSEIDEERRLEQERQARERHDMWKRAVAQATLQLVDEHREGVLRRQVTAWRFAEDIRAWSSATRANLADRDGCDGTNEWLSWADAYADRIDPILRPTGMPTTPKPTPESLRPFLNGWSPYGP
jgi:hypothetical protein